MIKLAANSATNLDLDTPLIDDITVNTWLFETYRSLDKEGRGLLLRFAILPSSKLSKVEMSEIWPRFQPGDAQIRSLLSCSLVDNTEFDLGLFAIDGAIRGHIQALYQVDPDTQRQIDQVLDEMDGRNAATLEVMEHSLLTGWFDHDDLRKLLWLEAYADRGLSAGHYATWASLLSEPNRSLELQMDRAICLRALADYTAAAALCAEIIERAGHTGDFRCQARALIELSVIYRHTL